MDLLEFRQTQLSSRCFRRAARILRGGWIEEELHLSMAFRCLTAADEVLLSRQCSFIVRFCQTREIVVELAAKFSLRIGETATISCSEFQ